MSIILYLHCQLYTSSPCVLSLRFSLPYTWNSEVVNTASVLFLWQCHFFHDYRYKYLKLKMFFSALLEWHYFHVYHWYIILFAHQVFWITSRCIFFYIAYTWIFLTIQFESFSLSVSLKTITLKTIYIYRHDSCWVLLFSSYFTWHMVFPLML